jgi:hypothetical protein
MSAGESGELPDVLLTSIRDGVVSEKTRICYISEIFNFLFWVRQNEQAILTDDGKEAMNEYVSAVPEGATSKQVYTKCKRKFDDLLRDAQNKPVFDVVALTPDTYMNYLRSLRNQKNRLYLGKSTIGVKRSALFHLYRLHNGAGYPDGFKLSLNNLCRGFFRVLTSRRTAASTIVQDGVEVAVPKWNQVSFFVFVYYTYISNKYFLYVNRMKARNR